MEAQPAGTRARNEEDIASHTGVPPWLVALSFASMLTIVAALVVIAGVLHAPLLGFIIAALLFVALSTGLRRVARRHARSHSNVP
jgi:heme/copper-type cytochrome/quinol oxidase subunit 4